MFGLPLMSFTWQARLFAFSWQAQYLVNVHIASAGRGQRLVPSLLAKEFEAPAATPATAANWAVSAQLWHAVAREPLAYH